jgi:hypothetical protein
MFYERTKGIPAKGIPFVLDKEEFLSTTETPTP